MLKRYLFNGISILILTLMILAIANPVLASSTSKPEVFSFPIYGEDVLIAGQNGNPCSFDVLNVESGTFRSLTWYDENGQWTRMVQLYGNLKVDWVANGKTVNVGIQGPVQMTVQYLPDRNVVTMVGTGVSNLFTIPGYGVVMGTAGRIITTWTFTPDWSTLLSLTTDSQVGLNATDAAALCSYLAP